MNQRMKKKIDGAISIMLIAILLPTMLLSGLMVDLSRYNMAKAMISSAGDLTMNAALADYDGILQDVYGLFAISQDDDDLYKNLEQYFETTLVSNGVVTEKDSKEYVKTLLYNIEKYLYVGDNGEAEITNLFDMDIVSDSTVSGVKESTLANDQVLKKQIVEYMKYRAPMNCALSFFSGLSAMGKSGEQADVVQAKLDAEKNTQTVADRAIKLWEAIQDYDKELYHSKNFSADYTDERGSSDVTVNNTEQLADWANSEVKKAKVYKYQLVNRYILGFLIDDKQEDITDGGKVTSKAGDGLIKAGDAATDAAESLETATDRFIGMLELFTDPAAGHEACADNLNQQLGSSVLKQENSSKDNVRNQVRNNYAVAVNDYKVMFKILCHANEKDSNGQESLEKLTVRTFQETFLPSKNNFNKTYAAAEVLKTDLETRKTEISNNPNSASSPDELTEVQGGIDALEEAMKYAADEATKWQLSYDGTTFGEAEIELKIADMIEKLYQVYQRYGWYLETAKEYTDNLIDGIYKESSYVYNKTEKLLSLSRSVYNEATELKKAIRSYNTSLDEWGRANEEYQKNTRAEENASGAEDEFVTNNAEEIKDKKERYDENEIEEVRKYAEEQMSNLDPFMAYLTGEGYQYSGKKFYDLDQVDKIIKTVKKKSPEFVNKKETISVQECDQKFKELCPEPAKGYEYTETTTHVRSFTHEDFQNDSHKKEKLLPFVGYLMCTYPKKGELTQTQSENTVLDVIDADGNTAKADAKNLYTKMKDSLKSDKGKEVGDGDGKKYGYTYAGKKTPGEGNKTKKAATTADVDKNDASSIYESQNSGLKSTFKDIQKALKTGRDNVYVMEYIFGNFSYNTMVQDKAYENFPQKEGFYAAVLAQGDSIYEEYKALDINEKAKLEEKKETDPHEKTRPKNLSGYPIAEYNNKYYGAEVEYLLYGYEGAENNVVSADAEIFAIRFIMNSIYAFSNTEIRNTTRTAGLAVQAASVGTIPYQVVMAVLQLALAMSESLLDLSVMHTGAKVAIVPTKNTWMLDSKNAGELLQDVAGEKVKETAKEGIEAAMSMVNMEIQEFIDASAEEMEGKINGLMRALRNSAQAKAEELTNQVFAQVEETMMGELNKLQYMDADTSEAEVEAVLDNTIAEARKSKDQALDAMENAGGEIGGAIRKSVDIGLESAIVQMDTKAKTIFHNLSVENAGKSVPSYATTLCNTLQLQFSELLTSTISATFRAISQSAVRVIDGTENELKVLAKDKTEKGKEAMIEKVNSVIDEKINTVTDKMPDWSGLASTNQTVDGTGAASRALAFGYGDYLRVFLFVRLCSGEQVHILERTADLIESNINYPNEKASEEAAKKGNKSWFAETFERISWFFTKKKPGTSSADDDKWKASKACTYVKVDADIDMKMLFLDTDLFSAMINAAYLEAGEAAPDLSATKSTFHYHSVMGY